MAILDGILGRSSASTSVTKPPCRASLATIRTPAPTGCLRRRRLRRPSRLRRGCRRGSDDRTSPLSSSGSRYAAQQGSVALQKESLNKSCWRQPRGSGSVLATTAETLGVPPWRRLAEHAAGEGAAEGVRLRVLRGVSSAAHVAALQLMLFNGSSKRRRRRRQARLRSEQ